MSSVKGRKPADRYRPGKTPREVIWATIRQQAGASFSANSVAEKARLDPRTVDDYFVGLVASGHLVRVGEASRSRRNQAVMLVRDTGHEAPRVRRDGSVVEQGGGTEAMWRTMQVLGEFTSDDVAHHATTDRCGVSVETAASYVQSLARAGYLRVVRPASNAGRRALYRLIRRTGPRPPQVQRVKQVYDPNTGEVLGADVDRSGVAAPVEELA